MGAAPLAPLGHVESLHDLGVSGVINLCDEYSGPVLQYQQYGIEQLHLPTVDHFEPTVSDLCRAVDFISLRHSKGQKTFVHCKAGHGRSAAVALAWLATQNPGVSPQLLNQRLSEKRKVRKTLYKQNCIKGFLRERGLLKGLGKGGGGGGGGGGGEIELGDLDKEKGKKKERGRRGGGWGGKEEDGKD